MRISLISLVVVACAVSSAQAGLYSQFTNSGTVSIDGTDYNVWRMYITSFDSGSGNLRDGEWLNALLQIDLTQGSIFHDPAGSLLPPKSADFEVSPNMEWDSYNSAPIESNTRLVPVFTATALALDVSWYDVVDNGPLTFMAAQITLSTDAEGTFFSKIYDGEKPGVGVKLWGDVLLPEDSLFLANGTIVPEPASMAVLGFGALALLRRRR
jgi:hypothetical protein